VLVEESLLKLIDFEESEEVVLLDEIVPLPDDALLEEVNDVEDVGEVVEVFVLVPEELIAAVKVKLIMYYVTGLQIFSVLHAFIKNK
jgi:hypothetical protein